MNICECKHTREQHYNNFITGNSCRECSCSAFKEKENKPCPVCGKTDLAHPAHTFRCAEIELLWSERDSLIKDVETLYSEMVEDDETIIELSKRLAEYEGENKRWHSFETVQAIVKERDSLREQLDIAKNALKSLAKLPYHSPEPYYQDLANDALKDIKKIKRE